MRKSCTCVEENWDLETPLVGSPYEVRELLGRRITTIRSRKWHVAARMGAQDNYIRRVGETPPAVRRASPRVAMNFLRSPFQTGAPGAMHTDAPFGFSRIGDQSILIALAICDGRGNVPLRIRGTSS